MIQYSLKCSEGHSFESWFQSAAAFDKLSASGLVNCAICGGNQVEKAMMTPRVRPARSAAGSQDTERPLSAPASPAEQMLAELRKKIEQNSDYVGKDFAAEARKMHLGETPERSIYGEARVEEAKALLEDGIPVSPLPFLPNRKAN
ncbi:DUF1178 family protein [Ruegeria sp. WL0004]|uniref:DUF1178 family protein n=1 Tax=Ruegeria marisflavi TaxID=2984152 RepID=A0ABT2WR26_9RHOB|nr:DUF1178 family protein [Ruegeria sp. WL0004]MCU9838352.1 DUF1178 family protein [Ruegeria sp. WL0004]